jgi:hypothetical protein
LIIADHRGNSRCTQEWLADTPRHETKVGSGRVVKSSVNPSVDVHWTTKNPRCPGCEYLTFPPVWLHSLLIGCCTRSVITVLRIANCRVLLMRPQFAGAEIQFWSWDCISVGVQTQFNRIICLASHSADMYKSSEFQQFSLEPSVL